MAEMTLDQQRAIAMARARLRLQQPNFTPREPSPADIPGAIEQPTYQEPSMTDRLLGLPETAATIISGGASGLAGQVAGIFGGKLGQGPNVKLAEKIMEAGTYRPTGEGAQANLQSLGALTSGLPAATPLIGQAGQVAQGVKALAARATPTINALQNPFIERGAQRQQRLVTQSYENANLIDAANAANRLGVAVNPAVTNPTIPNRIVGAISGNPEAKMARTNEPQWTRKAKEDMGLSPNTTLNEQAFGEALKNPLIVEPYKAVGKLNQVVPDQDIINKINALKDEALIVSKSSYNEVSKLVDENLERLIPGVSGEELLKKIQILRGAAQRTYRSEKKGIDAPSKESMAVADASMALANQLEDAASLYLTGTQMRELQNARTLAAKVFDYQRATDTRTGHLDPIRFAKITEGKPLTGTASDIATVAANFPGVSEVKPGSWVSAIPTILRGGTGGTLGYGIGSAFGMGPLGAVVGTTSGAVTNALMAKRMSSPAYQAANAIPRDYRLPDNMLRPVVPGSVGKQPSNLAIFNPESAVLPPEYTPNFTMPGRQEPPPSPRSAYEAAQQVLQEEGLRRTGSLGPDMQFAAPRELPMPGAEGPVQERIYNYARDKAVDEAAAAAAQRGPRQPAAGGMLYELDPFTGKLRPVDQGVKGATPETFVNYGSALESAVGKVMRGERPTMTAEEMIAWKKTRVDLAKADPSYAKLSDKDLAEKIMGSESIAIGQGWRMVAPSKSKVKNALAPENQNNLAP